ncbi:MAG: ABC transporter permease, partial [Candidatus Promineifilaceae bacterium]
MMGPAENLRLALAGLAANKLRAGLTMLGIMIGVAAVITLLSIGDGVNRFIAGQFIGLGSNLVFVLPNEDPNRAEVSLTLADAEALADPARLPGAQAVAPLYMRNVEVQYEGTRLQTSLRGSTPDYGPLRDYRPVAGRFLNAEDYSGRSRVVVLGAETAERLFPADVYPLQTTVRLNGDSFQVIGILGEQGGSAFGSQ